MTNIDTLKGRLIEAVLCETKRMGITQKTLADLLDTTQPRVSNMLTGQLEKFSLDTLFKYVYDLGIKVEIHLGE